MGTKFYSAWIVGLMCAMLTDLTAQATTCSNLQIISAPAGKKLVNPKISGRIFSYAEESQIGGSTVHQPKYRDVGPDRIYGTADDGPTIALPIGPAQTGCSPANDGRYLVYETLEHQANADLYTIRAFDTVNSSSVTFGAEDIRPTLPVIPFVCGDPRDRLNITAENHQLAYFSRHCYLSNGTYWNTCTLGGATHACGGNTTTQIAPVDGFFPGRGFDAMNGPGGTASDVYVVAHDMFSQQVLVGWHGATQSITTSAPGLFKQLAFGYLIFSAGDHFAAMNASNPSSQIPNLFSSSSSFGSPHDDEAIVSENYPLIVAARGYWGSSLNHVIASVVGSGETLVALPAGYKAVEFSADANMVVFSLVPSLGGNAPQNLGVTYCTP